MSGNVERSTIPGEIAPTASAGVERRDLVVLGLILLVASALRAIDLSSPLWYDEILMLTRSVRLPLGELVSEQFSFNNHPFYSVQAKAAIALLGESNQALRLPAMLFGVASVAAVWELARRLSDPLRAHVTALLVALSYHHIWYSQNARAYTSLMFWFVLATLVLIEGVRRPATKIWIAYGLVMAAALYSHLTAATFFIAQGVVVLAVLVWPGLQPGDVRARLPWSQPIAGFGLGGALTLLAYAPFLGAAVSGVVGMAETSAVDVMTEYQSPLWSALEILRSFARPSAATLGVAALAVALVVLGIAATGARDRIAAATLLVHVPVTLVFLLALSARIWPRFFFADMGFVLFFLVQGVFVVCDRIGGLLGERLPGRPSGRALFGVAAVAMLLISGALAARNYRHPKQDLAGAHDWVKARRADGDAVVVLGWVSTPYAEYFRTGWSVVGSRAELAGHESGDGRTWLVMGFPGRTSRRYPDVMAHLDSHYVLSRRFPGTLGDGDVLVYVEASRE